MIFYFQAVYHNQENKTNNPFEEIDVFCFPSMMESFDNSFGSNSFSSVSTTFLMYFESYVNEHLLSHIYSLKVDNQMIDPDGYLSWKYLYVIIIRYVKQYGNLISVESGFPSTDSIIRAATEISAMHITQFCVSVISVFTINK